MEYAGKKITNTRNEEILKFKFHLKSCNLIRIHAVISLSNQISDFHLLDDKMSAGKNTLAIIHNTVMVGGVALAGALTFFSELSKLKI